MNLIQAIQEAKLRNEENPIFPFVLTRPEFKGFWMIENDRHGKDILRVYTAEGHKEFTPHVEYMTTEDWEVVSSRDLPTYFDKCKELTKQSVVLREHEYSSTVAPMMSGDHEYVGGGAHVYYLEESVGFLGGKTHFTNTQQKIQFVQKDSDGKVTPGVLNEQLLIMLIDRTKKLYERFPSKETEKVIEKLEEALFWTDQRVSERKVRGVMGELKK